MPSATETVKKKKKPVVWNHKKYKNRVYLGSYETIILKKTKEKQRSFVLVSTLKNGKTHSVPFDSHEQARDAGWVGV